MRRVIQIDTVDPVTFLRWLFLGLCLILTLGLAWLSHGVFFREHDRIERSSLDVEPGDYVVSLPARELVALAELNRLWAAPPPVERRVSAEPTAASLDQWRVMAVLEFDVATGIERWAWIESGKVEERSSPRDVLRRRRRSRPAVEPERSADLIRVGVGDRVRLGDRWVEIESIDIESITVSGRGLERDREAFVVSPRDSGSQLTVDEEGGLLLRGASESSARRAM